MGFFNSILNNEPKRLSTVPEKAVWNDDDNQWELGKLNVFGNMVGEWKWWHSEGHLVCHTFYDKDGSEDMTYTRFHQDGTFSQKGAYVGEVKHGEFISQKSFNPTTEIYIPKNGFKAVTTFVEGKKVEEYYFDKDGNEIV